MGTEFSVPAFLLYRIGNAVLRFLSYRVKSPAGQDAHLAEKKLMLCIPLGRVSVRWRTLCLMYFIEIARVTTCHRRAFSAIIIQMFFTFKIILVYKQG